MRFPKTLVAAGALALLVTTPPLFAQTQDPSPIQTEDEAAESTPEIDPAKLARAGFVRVWYFGVPGSPLATAAIRSPEGGLKVIGSGIRPDRMLSYRPLRPGTYTLSIFDGDLVPDASGQMPAGAAPRATVPVKIDRGAYATVIIRFIEGKWTATTFTDTPLKGETGPAFRVFEFVEIPGAKLSLIRGDETKVLWSSGAGNTGETTLPGFVGSARFELGKSIDDRFVTTASTETELSARRSYSLILYADRYGNEAFAVIENARASVDPTELDTIGD